MVIPAWDYADLTGRDEGGGDGGRQYGCCFWPARLLFLFRSSTWWMCPVSLRILVMVAS
jgi:hypothetical protein